MMQTRPPSPLSELRQRPWQAFKDGLSKFNAWLIEPRSEVVSPLERSRASLLAVILLIVLIAHAIRNLSSYPNREFFWFLVLVGLAAYFLARTRYYPAAAWLLILDLTLPSYIQVLGQGAQATPDSFFVRFAWLVFPLILCGLIASDTTVILYTGLNMLGIGLTIHWLPGVGLADAWPAIGFLGFMGILVITVTHQLTVMEREHQAQELQRERQLNRVSQAINQALDLNVVLETVVQIATQLSQAGACLLSLVSPDGERLEQVLGYGLPEEQIRQRPPKGVGLAWQTILTRQAILLNEYAQHPQGLPEVKQSRVIHAYLSVPVLAGDDCLGALAVTTIQRGKKFNRRDQEMLESIARQAAIAIQNARLYTALQCELAERSRAESALRQRDTLLEAMAQASGQFLKSQDWHSYVQTLLAELGRITQSSHACLFQNQVGPEGELAASQIYQWTAPDAVSTLEWAEFQNVPLLSPGLENWRQAMQRGEPFCGLYSALSPLERSRLTPRGALSILEMPVYVLPQYNTAQANESELSQIEWWGTIGFDNYAEEHVWNQAEIDAIRLAASILSAAIQRQQADQAIRERENIYRRAISAADAVPYRTEYGPKRFVFLGEGIRQLTGYSAAEMDSPLWQQCIVQAIPLGEASGLSEAQAEQMAQAGRLTDWRCDYLFRTRSGELRWIADTGVEVLRPDGASHGCIGILQDITDRKQAEQTFLQVQAHLEKRVQERTAALEAANKEMEAFAYSVSHDLRAPLRAIDGYSRILLTDHRDQLGQDGQECLDNVRQATQQMNQLIDDLLQLSRITRHEMRTAAVDLSELAAELLNALERQDPQREVQVRIQPGLVALGDLNLLRIALGNLFSNAWKFTRKTSPARIEFGCRSVEQMAVLPADLPPLEAHTPIFYVQDNGAGFDMKYIAKLFQAFQRLHSPQEFEGTGIGLVIVQRVIHRHHGYVWAEGAPDQGATFYFTLAMPGSEPHEPRP